MVLLPMVLMAVSSCVSTKMREAQNAGKVALSAGAPRWVGQPLGWSKLEEIERWLQFDSEGYDNAWRLQGELTLGEGRLSFAQREAPEGTPSAAWLTRLGSAQAGFERVLDNPMHNRAQENRARLGLSQVAELRSRAVRPEAVLSRPADIPRVTRAQWGARSPVEARLDPARGTYNRITIHHTANVPGTRFDGSLSDSVNVLRTVQRVHMDQRNYGDIGYHFLIDSAGRVFDGRSLVYQGAHAGGTNNQRNIGICMIGNFEVGAPSSRAMASLNKLLESLRREHSILRTGLVAHGELKATKCPGAILARWTRNYRSGGPTLAQLGGRAPSTSIARVSSSTGVR